MSRPKDNKVHWQIILLIVVTALTGAVFVKSLKTDIQSHHEVMDSLRLVRQMNHENHETILRIRSFMVGSYDQLVYINSKLNYLNLQLQKSLRKELGKNEQQTMGGYQEYEKAFREEALQIEQFKSTQSVLKNSLAYLPSLLKEVKNKNVAYQLTTFLNRLLIFQQNINPEVGLELKQDLENLIPKFCRISPRDRSHLEDFHRHALLLVNYGMQRAQIEKTIFDRKVEKSLSNLEKKYFIVYTAREKNMNIYRSILLLFCGILGMGVIVLVTHVQVISSKLQDLNAALEDKVIQRTSQLNNALKVVEEKQQMLIQSTKMSALGEMAGGIAHEINTPLGTIMLYAQKMINRSQKNGHTEYTDGANNIIKIVGRIAKIITGLRRFSRDSSHEDKKESSLQEIFSDTMTLCQEKFKNHGIDIQIESTTAVIKCVPEQISQVILNLLNNAVDAIEGRPEKWIKISVQHFADRVDILVTDSGLGIPEAAQQKIMQPFFTTKEIGKGTGLGLSISRGIIESHGGELSYQAESKNTQFKITLPFSHQEKKAS